MSPEVRLARPVDAAEIWRAVAGCPQLDTNSFYCYWLLCREFSSSCAVAEAEDADGLLGFVTGFRSPARPDTVFVWQLYVAAPARGVGLAGRLLDRLLAELQPRRVEATVAPDNDASLAVFRALARRQHGRFVAEQCLTRDDFPPTSEPHGPELLVSVCW